MTDTTEHRAIALLGEYDALRADLRDIEEELNRECSEFGRTVLGVWGFSPSHLRQRLHALSTIKKERVK
jgi:HD-like signal output (HDOD) protein